MLRRPPRSTRHDTLVPYTTLFRSMREFGQCRLRLDLALGKRQRFAAAEAQIPTAVADPRRTREQFLEAARLGEQATQILRALVGLGADDEREEIGRAHV